MAKQKSRFPSYGLVRGPSHERGGVAGMVAGEQPVELEGGEWIIPKEAVPDYLPVLKQITNEGRAMQQMQNGNSAMDALIASASMETGVSKAKSPMFQDGGQIKLRKQQTKLPYQDGAPYVGTDKIDDVIDIINSMSSNQVGGFGQTLNPVGYYDMPEAGRLSKKSESQLSDAGYNKYAGDEEMETSTKAAIMFDLLQRGQYNNDLNALRQDFLKSDVRNISPQQEQGGMVDEYEGGGQLHSRRMYNQKDKKKYGYEMGGMMPEYQDGGEVSFLEKLPFIGPQLKGYREYQEADKYIDKRHRGQSLFSDDVNNRGIQVVGETTRQVESGDDEALKNLFNTAMVNYDPEESSRGIARFSKSDSGESALKKLLIGTPSGYRVSENDGRINYAVDPENIAEATSGKKLLGMFPVGYSGSVQPNIDTESQLDFSNLEALKSLAGYEQGGMINQYQQGGQMDRGAYPSKDLEMLQEYPISYKFFMDRRGEKAYYPEQDTLAARMFRGEINPNQAFSKALMLPFEDESRYGGGKQQMQPRKQQEIRNPETYGPPDSLMGPDTTMGNLDDLLNYYMESDRRNKLNALTGDTIDPQLDSLRLLQRMQKSKMPTYGRKNMQQGGQVLGKGQPLERRPSPSEQLAAMQAMEARPQDSLMSSMGEDKRVRPADKYIIKDGTMSKREMEVPKLSSAYLQSFGMETPLSKRQNDLLRHRALSPETLGINPQVQSLLGKALVQRLSNEPI